MVMTVTGAVDKAALGHVLMHEHLILDIESSFRGGMIATLDDVDLAIREVRLLRAAGGDTLVELTNRGMGRDVRKLRAIADATGLKIVAATGFYTERTYPPEVLTASTNELADVMVREVTEGIDGTQIRAGIIGEIGTYRRHISPAEERVFRAAARAQRATDVAISTHTYWGGELAMAQIDLLVEEGVPTSRIIIGHLGDKITCDYYAAIAERGVFIQFDHAGKEEYLRDIDRALIIRDMISRGHLEQILISSDLCYKSELHYYGGVGYDHVLTRFVECLREAGLGDGQLNQIFAVNPRTALAGT